MQAVLMPSYGGPEVLRLGEAPRPAPGQDELLIRVVAIGLNPADAKWRAGMFQAFQPLSFPHILGYDVAGLVVSAPADGPFRPGARVAAMLDRLRQGGYAEFAAVRASDAAALPEELEFQAAAAVPTPGLTGVQMIEEHLQVQSAERVLVTGAVGAVGRFAVWAAKMRGAHVTAAVRASQREAALSLGADEALTLGEAWGGETFACLADTVGGAHVATLCRHVAQSGRIFTAATTPIPTDGLAIRPIFFAVHPDGPRLAALLKAVESGGIRAGALRTLPLSAAAEAHRRLDAGAIGGKIILTP